MAEENFILVSLDDAKSKEISEVLGSETCKKIINYLIENKEASQKDLSDELKIPMNTLDYNIKKLLSSGFIQKRKNFFWSSKGKKITMYEVSNKSIVISHKKPSKDKIKSIIPGFMLIGAGTFAVWVFEKISAINRAIPNSFFEQDTIQLKATEAATAMASPEIITQVPTLISPQTFPIWGWFLAGGFIAMLVFSIVNWRKL